MVTHAYLSGRRIANIESVIRLSTLNTSFKVVKIDIFVIFLTFGALRLFYLLDLLGILNVSGSFRRSLVAISWLLLLLKLFLLLVELLMAVLVVLHVEEVGWRVDASE